MCDYSLHVMSSRPARSAETLVTSDFFGTKTRGFRSPADPATAVCLRPGTEIAFKNNARSVGLLFNRNVGDRLARFRQIHPERPDQHHDALEFANGAIVFVTDLVVGQKATVLQLPASPAERSETVSTLASASPALL